MNKRWNWCRTLCMALSLVSVTSVSHVYATDEIPTGLTAKGAVVLDMQSGQVLYDSHKDDLAFPASITKVMTCILALEKTDLRDLVTTSQLAREQEGNRVYLEVGEQEPMEQMLYGLMLNSGNDAAVAIAEHISGSVSKFADLMNEKAQQLGATHTHFVTPNGLHDDNHVTTPYDMALIANYAMKNSKFREIVATQTYDWHGQAWDSHLVNLNPMLWNYDGATGVKTGFTDQAQQTMIASAKRGDREVLAVLMGVQVKQTIRLETTQLLDYGFDQFTTARLAQTGDTLGTFEANGQEVHAVLHQDVYGTLPISDTAKMEPSVHLTVPTAPFPKGSKVGSVDYLLQGKRVLTADLYAASDVLSPVIPTGQAKTRTFTYVLLTTAGLAFLTVWFWKRRVRRLRQVTTSYKGH
ncbi:D-alanyl-D-alanine carboxypeptidase family protein [Tumebacillus permanentifrigoris]|uniref:serine-type D-Ala-D-Ala carboxypeptidase n=1 Tax=Tumebacillus permanentifrigoris TaxID=378543 RepID=A0A316DBK3_9BACL|nr:D-alanyl-D-alanine carboxypeptidase family protein [Tumebacillus permanentifrigoris]PWK14462.1 D-alanyl-D-alanine carboxypeptidase (penicillin-binding protein 5/6) [Tumebacillus permanentifrigoris]